MITSDQTDISVPDPQKESGYGSVEHSLALEYPCFDFLLAPVSVSFCSLDSDALTCDLIPAYRDPISIACSTALYLDAIIVSECVLLPPCLIFSCFGGGERIAEPLFVLLIG